jgi:ribosomal protein S27AE
MNKLVVIEQLLQADLLPETRAALRYEKATNCQRQCPRCQTVFWPTHGQQRYCSGRCANILRVQRHRMKKQTASAGVAHQAEGETTGSASHTDEQLCWSTSSGALPAVGTLVGGFRLLHRYEKPPVLLGHEWLWH